MRVAIQCERIVLGFSGGVEHFAVGLLGGLASLAGPRDEFSLTVARGTAAGWRERVSGSDELHFVEVLATASVAHSTAWMWRVPGVRGLRSRLVRSVLVRTLLRRLRGRIEATALAKLRPHVVYSPFHLVDSDAPNLVLTVHDLKELQPHLHDPATADLLLENLNRARAIVTSWPYPYTQLLEVGVGVAEKLFLVPHPVMTPPMETSDGEETSEPILIYPAATSTHKNHVRLIEALAEVLEHRKVRLICTGTRVSPGYERAASAARRLGIVEAVEFPGHVPEQELQRLYNAAVAVVAPTLWEAGSGAVVEAFARGKPVACSDVPPIRSHIEFCGGAARFFDPANPSSIADAILEIIENPEPYQYGSRRAARFLGQLTWERTARDYLAVFNWVAAGAGTSERPRLSFDADSAVAAALPSEA